MLRQHVDKVLQSERDSKKHRITVRRGHLLEDTRRSLTTYDETKHIRVTFLGEAAVDDGGPRRELFMLLMGEIANNGSLLDGPPNRRVLRHNVVAFKVCFFLLKTVNVATCNNFFNALFDAKYMHTSIFSTG